MTPKRIAGFTLAELLIALAILGVIATFTIPKVLQAQTDGKYKAIAKEAFGTVSAAYVAYQRSNTPNALTKPGDLIPYMNYLKMDTASVIDKGPGQWAFTCNSTDPCYQLHNGGTLLAWNDDCFGGTASTNLIYFGLDPDGTYSGTTNGPGKALAIALYANGRVATIATLYSNSQTDWQCDGSLGVEVADPVGDPSWFNWN